MTSKYYTRQCKNKAFHPLYLALVNWNRFQDDGKKRFGKASRGKARAPSHLDSLLVMGFGYALSEASVTRLNLLLVANPSVFDRPYSQPYTSENNACTQTCGRSPLESQVFFLATHPRLKPSHRRPTRH
jgi:hypothetical protein